MCSTCVIERPLDITGSKCDEHIESQDVGMEKQDLINFGLR